MLSFIPTPIGNLEDISQRSLRLLASATLLFCEDTRETKRLLALLTERYGIQSTPKTFISLHSHNENEVLKTLDPTLLSQPCCYVSDAGMPAISDPGAALVRFCQAHGIAYEVIPGANAALLAYAASGFEETGFSFFGFLPHKGRERELALSHLLEHPLNVVLYESPHRIEKLMEELVKKAPQRMLFAIKEATKKHEKMFLGTALHVKELMQEANLKGEWALVIKKASLEQTTSPLTLEDILHLSLPPKEKAKLLSKMTGESVKEWYVKLQA